MIHTSMFQKHIHKVKFYPSADDFTQALLVMLVTNITSAIKFVILFKEQEQNPIKRFHTWGIAGEGPYGKRLEMYLFYWWTLLHFHWKKKNRKII